MNILYYNIDKFVQKGYRKLDLGREWKAVGQMGLDGFQQNVKKKEDSRLNVTSTYDGQCKVL